MVNLSTVYLMVGIPGSGKTTYTEKIKNAKYIGTDAIRKELLGKELTLREHVRVHAIMHAKIYHYLNKGQDIIIDSMNITRKQRKVLSDLMPKNTSIIVIYLKTSLFRTIKNNWRRSRHVPLIGIFYFYLKRQSPSMEEGFTKIICIK